MSVITHHIHYMPEAAGRERNEGEDYNHSWDETHEIIDVLTDDYDSRMAESKHTGPLADWRREPIEIRVTTANAIALDITRAMRTIAESRGFETPSAKGYANLVMAMEKAAIPVKSVSVTELTLGDVIVDDFGDSCGAVIEKEAIGNAYETRTDVRMFRVVHGIDEEELRGDEIVTILDGIDARIQHVRTPIHIRQTQRHAVLDLQVDQFSH